MKHWIEVDSTGRIVSVGHGAEVPQGAIETDEAAHPFAQAWDGEKLIDLPPRPSGHHIPSADGWVLDPQRLAIEKLSERNALLARSDWTQMPDHPMSAERRAAWAAYRQALRDITKAADWPLTLFPKTPE